MNTRISRRKKGFTLIELLTVIAIIGILAGIIIPVTGAVRKAAKKAQTRTMFSQWGSAFTLFKQEYGYYPEVGTDGTDNLLSTTADTLQFVRTFTGKNLDGTAVTLVADLNGNKRRMALYSFSDTELPTSTNLLTDAFGNTQFGVVVDRNGDGLIKMDETGGIQAVAPAGGGASFTPSATDIPTDGVRAHVIFYSAGHDGSVKDAVMSWK